MRESDKLGKTDACRDRETNIHIDRKRETDTISTESPYSWPYSTDVCVRLISSYSDSSFLKSSYFFHCTGLSAHSLLV